MCAVSISAEYKVKSRQVPSAGSILYHHFRVNFRENQCVVFMFYCTLSCNVEHNKSIDFTGLSENFLYLLVFADFQRIRFESGQRHLQKLSEWFRELFSALK